MKSDYWGHTPIFWKKVGEAVRNLGVGITGMGIYNDNHTMAAAALLTMWLGNTIINFIGEAGSDKIN